MPIVDYKRNAELVEKRFFSNDKISQTNKDLIQKFLKVYDTKVSPARKGIFLRHIKFLLEETQDLSQEMNDRDKINTIFHNFSQTLSPSYYTTIINVSLRFVRWLNDGDKPKGFKDIQNSPKKSQKRNLKPSDMISWEDGLKLINQSASMQIKAVIMTQLDGGFRPSEFVDLKYGDCEKKKEFIIITIQDGKTGSRMVTLYKSVPYLSAWLQNHPTKKSNDPLWLQEKNTHGTVIQFNYPALKKRIVILGEKANIKKPLDFYNLRHSACVISKLDNVPEELASEKFGHSIEYYTGTYGRLSSEDRMKRYSSVYGNAEEEEKKKQSQKNVICSRCDTPNAPNTDLCGKCGSAITLTKALSEKEEMKKELLLYFKEQSKKEIIAELTAK